MADSEGIRWKQRYINFTRALQRLSEAVELSHERPLTALESLGLIQAFEFTHELAWNTVKDFYQYQGEANIQGSRDATRMAAARGLIDEPDTWMEMIKSRNKSSHTYNEDTADEISELIRNEYHSAFLQLHSRLAEEI